MCIIPYPNYYFQMVSSAWWYQDSEPKTKWFENWLKIKTVVRSGEDFPLRYCDFETQEDFESIFGDSVYPEEVYKIVYESWKEENLEKYPQIPQAFYARMIEVDDIKYPDIPGHLGIGCLHTYCVSCDKWETYGTLSEILHFVDNNFKFTSFDFYTIYETITAGQSLAYHFEHSWC